MTYELRSAVYLIMSRDDQVLLLLRQNTGYMDGMYDLPAGHIERGENATDGVIREAGEEVGVVVTRQDVQVAHVMHRFNRDSENLHLVYFCVYFVAGRWQGEPTNYEPEKCGDVRWFPLSELPENCVPFTRRVLEEHWPQGVGYSEYGWDAARS
jgi:ADP-ribose pyrophosphatase YjhB (NUDIX family)